MVSAMMLLLLTRIAALATVATVVLLTLMLLPMVSTVAGPISTTILMRELWWHLRWATLKINIYSACVVLCGILQSHLSADLLDAWLDLLDMIGRMISFSYNTIWPQKKKLRQPLTVSRLFKSFLVFNIHVKMGLSLGLGIFYARLKNILCLLNELAM